MKFALFLTAALVTAAHAQPVGEEMKGFVVKPKVVEATLAQAPDGSLRLSDDSGGIIYRISYRPEVAQTP